MPGYNCIIQGKSCSEKSGLVIYIDTRFKYEVLINLNEYEYWEGQIIKVTGGGLPKEIIIGNIYRPPRMLHDQIRQFINELTVLMTNIENKNDVILAGDYNLNYITPKYKKIIYNTLVLPHMNYCIMAWGSQCERIYKVQKKAVRILTTSRYNSHTDPLFKRLNL